jgi:hypothetical protein
MLLLGLSIGFIFSCKSLQKINMESENQNESLKNVSDFLVYKSDTFKIEQDTIFVNTNKEVKKIKESDIIKQDSTSVEFVGNTEIQKAISSNTNIPANAGIGLRFTKKFGSPTSLLQIDRLELDLSISIASTVDTIKAKVDNNNEITNVNAFGNSILLPLNSGQSVSLNFRTFMNKRNTRNIVLGQNWGIQGSLSASNRVWEFSGKSQNVSTLALNLGLFSELIPTNIMDKFSISGGIDLSSRWIFGNVGHKYAEDFRESIIETKKTFFCGLEPNITIRLRDIKAVASFPVLFSKYDVPGLTKGQFVTMIRFTGGFPLSLAKK